MHPIEKFFDLRRIFVAALTDNPMSVVMNMFIDDEYIDPLKKEIAKSGQSEELQGYLDAWIDLTEEEGVFDKLAYSIAKRKIDKHPVHAEVDDEILEVKYRLLKSGMKIFQRIKPTTKDGPVQVKKLFNTVVGRRVLDSLNHQKRKAPQGISVYDMGEGEEAPLVEQLEAPKTLTIEDLKKMKWMWRGLRNYVQRKTDDDDEITLTIFDVWMDLTKRKPGKTEWKPIYKGLIKELKKQGEEIPKSGMSRRRYEKLRKVIVAYFEEELEYLLTKEVKRKLVPKSASNIIENITEDMFRRYILAYVLKTSTIDWSKNPSLEELDDNSAKFEKEIEEAGWRPQGYIGFWEHRKHPYIFVDLNGAVGQVMGLEDDDYELDQIFVDDLDELNSYLKSRKYKSAVKKASKRRIAKKKGWRKHEGKRSAFFGLSDVYSNRRYEDYVVMLDLKGFWETYPIVDGVAQLNPRDMISKTKSLAQATKTMM